MRKIRRDGKWFSQCLKILPYTIASIYFAKKKLILKLKSPFYWHLKLVIIFFQQAWIQGTPAENSKTHQWSKLLHLVSSMMLNRHAKMKSKDHVILEVLIYKDQAIWLTESILGSKFKIQTIKLLQITEWICYFYGCLPICIKSASYLNSVLTYSRFKIDNYFGHAQVFLTTPIWIDWIIIDVFVYT